MEVTSLGDRRRPGTLGLAALMWTCSPAEGPACTPMWRSTASISIIARAPWRPERTEGGAGEVTSMGTPSVWLPGASPRACSSAGDKGKTESSRSHDQSVKGAGQPPPPATRSSMQPSRRRHKPRLTCGEGSSQYRDRGQSPLASQAMFSAWSTPIASRKQSPTLLSRARASSMRRPSSKPPMRASASPKPSASPPRLGDMARPAAPAGARATISNSTLKPRSVMGASLSSSATSRSTSLRGTPSQRKESWVKRPVPHKPGNFSERTRSGAEHRKVLRPILRSKVSTKA
mmetsp:Transcript_109233/g.314604  ORF Transcript_109233/g.314604 Transcript_109233/m.314604 type:complete len:289 (+) Transcript_109233:329-1195(+)